MTEKCKIGYRLLLLGLLCGVWILGGCSSLGNGPTPIARVYYDAYHGARHLWDRDNERYRISYHTVSGYNRFYRALQEEGFAVHVEDRHGFDRATLDKYDVFFVGEQTYHARFMTAKERRDLLAWVRAGGGLFAVVEHTNAHYMSDVFDLLFHDLPVKAGRDSIADLNQAGPLSPTWVDLPRAKSHPLTRGVGEYRFYNGATLKTEHGVLFSAPTSWSDRWDPKAKPIHNGNKQRDPDELAGPHPGVAAFNYGKGRIVVIADHNVFSNPNLYWGDHYRFGMNAFSWLAGCELDLAKRVVPGRGNSETVDLFVHLGNDSAMKYMTKEPGGYFTLYGQWTKEPQLRPWAAEKLKPGYGALFLSAPRKEYSPAQLAVIDDYLNRGKSVVYLATGNSLKSTAGRQLQERFKFSAQVNGTTNLPSGRTPFIVRGPASLLAGIFRMYIYKGTPRVTHNRGLHTVRLTRGGYHIEEKRWEREEDNFNLLTEIPQGKGRGRFMILAPMEIFTGQGLRHLYEDADVVRQQMAEFIIRLAKYVT